MRKIYIVKWNNGFKQFFTNKKKFDEKIKNKKNCYKYIAENRITD